MAHKKPTWDRFPPHSRPIATAPQNSTQPVRLYDASGRSRWGIYYRDGWKAVEVMRDAGGDKHVRMNGDKINAVRWSS